MRKWYVWTILAVLAVVVGARFVWASSDDTATMTPSASEDWSRGRVMGLTALKRRAALQVAADGSAVLVWPNLEGQLQLVIVGLSGEVLVDTVLPHAESAVDPQLQIGQDGSIHILWREGPATEASIRHLLLAADGTPSGEALVLSDPASSSIADPRLVLDAQGRPHALWVDATGIYWAMLDAQGTAVEDGGLLVADGFGLDVQADDAGAVHLIWQEEYDLNALKIFYALLDAETNAMTTPEEMLEIQNSGRLGIEEIALALTDETGYVLVAGYDRSFDRYMFQHVAFALDEPSQKDEGIWVLRSGVGPVDASPLGGQHTPLTFAISEQVGLGRQRIELQSAIISLQEGELVEEVVSASPSASSRSAVAVDSASNMHMVWLDTAGFRQYHVVYGSTSPTIKEQYDIMSPRDTLNAVLDQVFQLSLVVVGAFPGLVAWALVPFLGLVVYHLRTSEEALETSRSWIVLGVALLLEVVLSFAFPLHIISEISWAGIRWVAPAVSALVAGGVTAFSLRGGRRGQFLSAFLLFTLVNTLVQVALYLLF